MSDSQEHTTLSFEQASTLADGYAIALDEMIRQYENGPQYLRPLIKHLSRIRTQFDIVATRAAAQEQELVRVLGKLAALNPKDTETAHRFAELNDRQIDLFTGKTKREERIRRSVRKMWRS